MICVANQPASQPTKPIKCQRKFTSKFISSLPSFLNWSSRLTSHNNMRWSYSSKKTHTCYLFMCCCCYCRVFFVHSVILFTWFLWCKLRIASKCEFTKRKKREKKLKFDTSKNSQWQIACYVKRADFRHFSHFVMLILLLEKRRRYLKMCAYKRKKHL